MKRSTAIWETDRTWRTAPSPPQLMYLAVGVCRLYWTCVKRIGLLGRPSPRALSLPTSTQLSPIKGGGGLFSPVTSTLSVMRKESYKDMAKSHLIYRFCLMLGRRGLREVQHWCSNLFDLITPKLGVGECPFWFGPL